MTTVTQLAYFLVAFSSLLMLIGAIGGVITTDERRSNASFVSFTTGFVILFLTSIWIIWDAYQG